MHLAEKFIDELLKDYPGKGVQKNLIFYHVVLKTLPVIFVLLWKIPELTI